MLRLLSALWLSSAPEPEPLRLYVHFATRNHLLQLLGYGWQELAAPCWDAHNLPVACGQVHSPPNRANAVQVTVAGGTSRRLIAGRWMGGGKDRRPAMNLD